MSRARPILLFQPSDHLNLQIWRSDSAFGRKPPRVRRGKGLRLTITQPVPKTLGAVSITIWCLLQGVRPPAASVFYGSLRVSANHR
jgi:hypothetical protein